MHPDQDTATGHPSPLHTGSAIGRWMIEVRDFINSLQDELQKKETCRNLYYGFSVFDGKMILKPEVLFIGINPSRGMGKRNHPVFMESERMSFMDQLDKHYYYHLAAENISLFRQAGKSEKEVRELLESGSARSYLFYMCTAIQLEMKYCLDLLGPNAYKEFYMKSIHFTTELIRILEPRLVICEGKMPFHAIIPENHADKNWDKQTHIGYFHDKGTGTQYLGYKRAINTIVSHKEELADRIRIILQ